jgi:hypothetical protein
MTHPGIKIGDAGVLTALPVIARGFGYIDGLGQHPGLPPFLLLLVLGLLGAGAWGGVVIFAVFGPLLCYGAFARGKMTKTTDRRRS